MNLLITFPFWCESLVSCPNRWSLYLPLALCINHLSILSTEIQGTAMYYEVTTLETLARYFGYKILTLCLFIIWTTSWYFLFDIFIYEVTCFATEMWTYRLYCLFEMKSPHWKHLHDTLNTEFTFDMNSQVFNSIILRLHDSSHFFSCH